MKGRYFEKRWPRLEAALKKEWLAAKQALLRKPQHTNHNISGVSHEC